MPSPFHYLKKTRKHHTMSPGNMLLFRVFVMATGKTKNTFNCTSCLPMVVRLFENATGCYSVCRYQLSMHLSYPTNLCIYWTDFTLKSVFEAILDWTHSFERSSIKHPLQLRCINRHNGQQRHHNFKAHGQPKTPRVLYGPGDRVASLKMIYTYIYIYICMYMCIYIYV